MTMEEAIERLKWVDPHNLEEKDLEAIRMAIDALQTEVVRCKDCRWWNEDDFPRAFPEKKTSACEVPNIYGANFSRYTQEDEFCSRGERKGGGSE